MRILVSGSSGLVGGSLVPFLRSREHEVTRLVRSSRISSDNQLHWDPGSGDIDLEGAGAIDAVVHLAGENIANKRWSEAQKSKIRDSRIQGTKLLCEKLAQLDSKPKVLVCASAIGYYGDRGDELLNESSDPGIGFLTDVCEEWEAATKAARDAGIRVVNVRFGIILSPCGGALQKMLLPFQLGLGGDLGNGKQYMSWIAVEDVVGAIFHAINTDSVEGPVNVVSPNPVTNKDFTKTMSKVLFRPAIFPAPAFVLKIVLGEMAEALLLSSSRVEPKKLLASGYEFKYPELEQALRHLLGK